MPITGTQIKNINVPHARMLCQPSEIKYVFEPFYRASNANRFEGHGVGLPLARNIIRLHKGELVIQSEEDKGTAIEITLHSLS